VSCDRFIHGHLIDWWCYLAIHSLQGALGKTSGRSYKAAPRQLLQVDSTPGSSPVMSPAHAHVSKASVQFKESGAAEAAKLGRAALGDAADVRILFVSVMSSLIFVLLFRMRIWFIRNH